MLEGERRHYRSVRSAHDNYLAARTDLELKLGSCCDAVAVEVAARAGGGSRGSYGSGMSAAEDGADGTVQSAAARMAAPRVRVRVVRQKTLRPSGSVEAGRRALLGKSSGSSV